MNWAMNEQTAGIMPRGVSDALRRIADGAASATRPPAAGETRAGANAGGIVGRSPALLAALARAAQVAPTDAAVLITGETGTGKELVARAIHEQSRRHAGALVKVNCGAIAAALAESELFGHERGAFTGALQQRRGRFELADGGTLFLDEVGELSPDTQVKLLRVLQEHEFERVGGSRPIRADVRVVAATNRDLRREVAAGRFRMDLFFRLNVFPLALPPLRERAGDVPLLAEHFLHRMGAKLGRSFRGFSPAALARLERHAWPGNVRELQNVCERAAILAAGPMVEVEEPLASALDAPAPQGTLESVERAHIVAMLEQADWRISGDHGAAALLGMKPSTLRSRMQKLAIRRAVAGA